MNHLIVVKVLKAFNDLYDEVLDLKLGNIFSFFEHFVQGVIAAEFQDYVNILTVLKNVIE